VPDQAGQSASAGSSTGGPVRTLAEASAKVRTGPPVDDPADADWPAWSGTVPLTLVRGAPVEA